MKSRGTGDPAGLEELGTSSSSTGPCSNVSSSVTSAQDEKIQRLVEQVKLLRQTMTKGSPPTTPVKIVSENGSKSTTTNISPSVKPSSEGESLTPSPVPMSARCERVSKILQAAKDKRLEKEGRQPDSAAKVKPNTSQNEYVLPSFVSCQSLSPETNYFSR